MKFLRYLRPFAPLMFFAIALWLLLHEVRQYHYRDVVRSLEAIPTGRVGLAMGLTAVNYLILIGYDLTAMRYLRHPLSLGKIALASFVSYVCSYNFGVLLGGTGVRYRMYSVWGIPGVEIIKLVAIVGLTFWIGLLALAGVVFVAVPLDIPAKLHMPFDNTRMFGLLLLPCLAVYLLLCTVRKAPVQFLGWRLPLPPLKLSLIQMAIAAADLMVAARVLYVLLPQTAKVDYPHFLSIYLLAVVATVITNVPGGLGVFELTVLVLLPPGDSRLILGSLLAYRAIYYLLPLLLASGLMGGNELALRRHLLRQVAGIVGQAAPAIVPGLFAMGAFLAGAILLLSGAFPTSPERRQWVKDLIPLSVFETSHFLGSVVGVTLLVVAQGLRRRLDAAYWMAIIMLAAGILAALLRGFDFEEAAVLLIVLLAIVPCGRHFYRKGSLVRQPFGIGWTVGVALVLLCSLWLGAFAHKHVEYSHDLWWRFTFRGDAPRFLRASVGAVGLALVFGLYRLLSPASPRPKPPTAEDSELAQRIAEASAGTYAYLALLGDKSLLFNDAGTAFLMYAVKGRSWVAMGDPVGPPGEAPGLILRLRELADAYDDWAVYYQIDGEHLSWYADLGLTAVKIGEEARVPLAEFSLEGGARKPLRKTHNRFARLGCSFEVVPKNDVPSLLPELKTVSDAWLREKRTREKRFSVGWFDPDYLSHFPAAVMRREGQMVAFANLLGSGGKEELSVDLMRYLPTAPDDVMEELFIQLMLWGQSQSYRWFNLGMAPLAGLEDHPLAPTWNRVGALIFRNGEEFYNFQGLRQFKDQFDPVWQPKYLASRGGFALPIILANVAAMINRK